MVNYQNGKIYKLVCNITGLIYIGSTCEKLSNRLAEHKKKYKKYLEGKCGFTSSYEIIDNGDYDIILIEDYSCERKEQLHARERYWIEQINCVNKYIPTRTKKEYIEDNKEKMLKVWKEYYQNNKEEINEKRKEKLVCKCGSIIRKDGMKEHYKSHIHNELIEKFNNKV